MTRKGSTSRFVNGVVAALVTLVFLVHGALGSFCVAFGRSGSLSWLVWGAVVLVGVHVVASLVTSVQQLNDAERPPSVRKKRHLALKWMTGLALALFACAHVLLPKSSVAALCLIMAVSVALAVHLCVCAKSLLKDLNVDRRFKVPFRVVVCVFAALFVLAMLKGVV